jgi:hypothetical protein
MAHGHHHEHAGERQADDLTRLARLLPHWIEHNAEHADEFRRWAERARDAGRGHIADHLEMAVQALTEAIRALQGAQAHMEGTVPETADHPHPH